MYSLKTTTIAVESGSDPLSIMRKYLARKGISRTYKYALPMVTRLNGIANKFRLTLLELNYLGISDQLSEICYAKTEPMPYKPDYLLIIGLSCKKSTKTFSNTIKAIIRFTLT